MKSGSPSRTTAAYTKHKIKPRPGPLSSSTVVTPPFIPSGAPPWDSRPVSGAGVVHYHSLHRPRSVPTALGPAPLVTYPHRPSQAGGYSRDCALLPPSPLSRGEPVRAAAAYLGGKDRRGERKETEGWGVTEKREGREEKIKKISVRFPDTLPLGPQPTERLTRGAMRWYWTSLVDGPMPLPPPGGRRWLLQSRAAGSESPVPCSSTNLVDGSRLRPTGERRRLLRSLSDGSHPSSSQEHGSESSVPPVLLLLQHHRCGQPLAVSATSCCPISSAPRSHSAARALWQRVPPSSRASAPM